MVRRTLWAGVEPHVVLDRAQDDVERALRVALDGRAQLHCAPVRLEEVGRHGDEHGGRLRDVPGEGQGEGEGEGEG